MYLKNLKILCGILAAVLVFLGVILAYLVVDKESDGTDVLKSYDQASHKEYTLDDEHVKFIGRSAEVDGEIVLSASGSGVEFICKGGYAEITLAPENSKVSASHSPRIALYSDSNLVAMECISEEKTYRVNTKYSGTVITLIKLSEAMHSSVKVTGIASYGLKDIEPTEKKDIRIEFIGDSITCGYGIDGTAYGTFSTETENFMKSYAYLTAEKLYADYSAVCYSGYGVLTGYTEDGEINDKLVMNEYEKACHLTKKDDPLWDFTKVKNDIVVINLGANDASYCGDDSKAKKRFIEAYVQMLMTVREKNPASYILCILGDMNSSFYPSVEKAVAQYVEQTADSRIEAFSVEFKMGENSSVIDGHPNYESNLCAAEALTEKINTLINPQLTER